MGWCIVPNHDQRFGGTGPQLTQERGRGGGVVVGLQFRLDKLAPVCEGEPSSGACNSTRCSTSNTRATAVLLQNQPFGSVRGKRLGPLSNGMDIPF